MRVVCLYVGCCVFFFKQKTAYEMRISDWSSDVCSSDLQHVFAQGQLLGDLRVLECARQTLIGPSLAALPPCLVFSEVNGAFAYGCNARNNIDQGGLARAVGTQEAQDLTAANLKVHAEQDFDAAV